MTHGLDDFARQLEDASRAFKSLDGDRSGGHRVPGDPMSVQAAFEQVEAVINRKAAPYRGNPLVDPVVRAPKEKYREHIIERGRERA